MDQVKLAGRCSCGVLDSMARGEEHLACRGQVRCKQCKEVRPEAGFHGRACKACYDAAKREGRARWRQKYPEVNRRISMEWRRDTTAYVLAKERKRAKYRQDPQWRQAHLAAQSERRAKVKTRRAA